MIQGIDVSHHDGPIDWVQVKAAGIGFAFVKATEGLDFVDSFEQTDFRAAMGQGLVVGLYHFFRPRLDPVKQANHFLSTFDPSHDQVMSCLDVEWCGNPNEWDGVTKNDAIARVREYLDTIRFRTQRAPVLYYSPAFLREYLSGLPMDGVIRWVAQYGETAPGDYTFWQYSEKGTVPGLNPGSVDLDRFEGSLELLQALAGVRI